HNKTPYELWNGRKPNISYFHIFGSKCFVLNNGKNHLNTFDEKSDEAIFLGYSMVSKAFRVFNKRTMFTEESIHVIFDEKHVDDKPSKHDHEVLDLSDKDEGVNKGDRMKPTEFIPFRSLPLKISQRNPDSDSAEPSGNSGYLKRRQFRKWQLSANPSGNTNNFCSSTRS
ncbi:unnamed protein product, partial [Cuscuta campestris]